MNRLALSKTTRSLLYGAMGSGIILALLPFALVLGTSPARLPRPRLPKAFLSYTDTCQGMCGRKRRGEVLAGHQ
jgi:hypothetical protein